MGFGAGWSVPLCVHVCGIAMHLSIYNCIYRVTPRLFSRGTVVRARLFKLDEDLEKKKKKKKEEEEKKRREVE